MKKSMKFKRYDEGGEVADKEKGLKASAGEDVGFFQRLRMGNIDDPTSEAYKRFGAGRGRSEAPAKQEETAPMPVARPSMKPRPIERSLSDDMYSDYGSSTGRGSAGTSETYSGPERGAPGTSETVRPSKPMTSTVSKPVAPAKTESVSKTTVTKTEPTKVESEKPVSTTSIMKQKPVADSSTFNAYDINNFAKPKAKVEETPKSTFKKNATSAPSGRNPGKDKEKGEPSGYKKNSTYAPSGRSGVKLSGGGSVSSASRRADGIASKGKTRCKIC